MKNRSLPRAEDIYKHFKGNLYQILTVGTHTETKEELVVYRALYGDFKTYIRPLSMFMEEVDKVKYPNCKEVYRFTRINEDEFPSEPEEKEALHLQNISEKEAKRKEDSPSEAFPKEEKVTPASPYSANDEEKAMQLFMEFLDESSFDKKRNILRAISPIATDHIINSMAASLDLVPSGISKDHDLKMISDYISARIHFDGSRLR